jgi:hypothetical protein
LAHGYCCHWKSVELAVLVVVLGWWLASMVRVDRELKESTGLWCPGRVVGWKLMELIWCHYSWMKKTYPFACCWFMVEILLNATMVRWFEMKRKCVGGLGCWVDEMSWGAMGGGDGGWTFLRVCNFDFCAKRHFCKNSQKSILRINKPISHHFPFRTTPQSSVSTPSRSITPIQSLL